MNNDFYFRERLHPIDWRAIDSIRLDRINLNELQDHVYDITFALIDEKDFKDPLAVKLIKMFQFCLEYLLYLRKTDAKEIQTIQDELWASDHQVKKVESSYEQLEKTNRINKAIIRKQKRTFLSCAELLRVHGPSSNAIATIEAAIEAVLEFQPDAEPIEKHKCIECGKMFRTIEYLNAHIDRRHQIETLNLSEAFNLEQEVKKLKELLQQQQQVAVEVAKLQERKQRLEQEDLELEEMDSPTVQVAEKDPQDEQIIAELRNELETVRATIGIQDAELKSTRMQVEEMRSELEATRVLIAAKDDQVVKMNKEIVILKSERGELVSAQDDTEFNQSIASQIGISKPEALREADPNLNPDDQQMNKEIEIPKPEAVQDDTEQQVVDKKIEIIKPEAVLRAADPVQDLAVIDLSPDDPQIDKEIVMLKPDSVQDETEGYLSPDDPHNVIPEPKAVRETDSVQDVNLNPNDDQMDKEIEIPKPEAIGEADPVQDEAEVNLSHQNVIPEPKAVREADSVQDVNLNPNDDQMDKEIVISKPEAVQDDTEQQVEANLNPDDDQMDKEIEIAVREEDPEAEVSLSPDDDQNVIPEPKEVQDELEADQTRIKTISLEDSGDYEIEKLYAESPEPYETINTILDRIENETKRYQVDPSPALYSPFQRRPFLKSKCQHNSEDCKRAVANIRQDLDLMCGKYGVNAKATTLSDAESQALRSNIANHLEILPENVLRMMLQHDQEITKLANEQYVKTETKRKSSILALRQHFEQATSKHRELALSALSPLSADDSNSEF